MTIFPRRGKGMTLFPFLGEGPFPLPGEGRAARTRPSSLISSFMSLV